MKKNKGLKKEAMSNFFFFFFTTGKTKYRC